MFRFRRSTVHIRHSNFLFSVNGKVWNDNNPSRESRQNSRVTLVARQTRIASGNATVVASTCNTPPKTSGLMTRSATFDSTGVKWSPLELSGLCTAPFLCSGLTPWNFQIVGQRPSASILRTSAVTFRIKERPHLRRILPGNSSVPVAWSSRSPSSFAQVPAQVSAQVSASPKQSWRPPLIQWKLQRSA